MELTRCEIFMFHFFSSWSLSLCSAWLSLRQRDTFVANVTIKLTVFDFDTEHNYPGFRLVSWKIMLECNWVRVLMLNIIYIYFINRQVVSCLSLQVFRYLVNILIDFETTWSSCTNSLLLFRRRRRKKKESWCRHHGRLNLVYLLLCWLHYHCSTSFCGSLLLHPDGRRERERERSDYETFEFIQNQKLSLFMHHVVGFRHVLYP